MMPLSTCQASFPAENLHTSQGLKVHAFRAKNYRIGDLILGLCVAWWTLMGQLKWLINLIKERVAKWTDM